MQGALSTKEPLQQMNKGSRVGWTRAAPSTTNGPVTPQFPLPESENKPGEGAGLPPDFELWQENGGGHTHICL